MEKKETTTPEVDWKEQELDNPMATKKKLFELTKVVKNKKNELEKRGKTQDGIEYDKKLRQTISEKIEQEEHLTAEEIADLGLEFKVIAYKNNKESKPKRRALRLQFDGVVYSKPKLYSSFYKKKLENKEPIKDVKIKSYNLEKNPYLKELAQFKEYDSYKKEFTNVLIETGIMPDEVEKLNFDDIKGCLVDVCKKSDSVRKDFRTGETWVAKDGGQMGTVFEGAREKFVKNVGKNYSKAVEKALIKSGRTPEEAKKEVNDMKEKGLAPRGFNVHHKYPIGGCGTKNYPDVNAPENFVIIENKSCHMAIHNFMEKTMGLNSYHRSKAGKEIYPIMVAPRDGAIFFAGSCKEMQVTNKQKNNPRLNYKNQSLSQSILTQRSR